MMITRVLATMVSLSVTASVLAEEAQWLTFEGNSEGIGSGKHIVLVSGDEEYRSEESCPMLAKILSKRFGFKTSVLFAINPEGGYLDSNYQKNIPGMGEIASADLVVVGTRFRDLPDEQLQPFADHLNAGKPVMGFRTATHGFRGGAKTGNIKWASFGINILGEKWVSHYGKHKSEGARSVVHEGAAEHAVLNGVGTVFAESDVYGVNAVTDENATILLDALVTETLAEDSAVVDGKVPQPAAWLRKYKTPDGVEGDAFCTTFGASSDLDDENCRRLFINAAIFLAGCEVPEAADVSYIDPFAPSAYTSNKGKGFYKALNLKPSDYGYGNSPQTGPAIETVIPADAPQNVE